MKTTLIGIVLLIIGIVSGSKTLEGIGIVIIFLFVMFLLFADDDRAVLFRMFILPIISIVAFVILVGFLIGKYIL